jgi:hypothetical protein
LRIALGVATVMSSEQRDTRSSSAITRGSSGSASAIDSRPLSRTSGTASSRRSIAGGNDAVSWGSSASSCGSTKVRPSWRASAQPMSSSVAAPISTSVSPIRSPVSRCRSSAACTCPSDTTPASTRIDASVRV